MADTTHRLQELTDVVSQLLSQQQAGPRPADVLPLDLIGQLSEFQQGPQDAVAATGADRAQKEEAVTSATRPEKVPPEELSRLQTILQSLFSAGTVFAGGLNPNVQPQDFLTDLRQLKQDQADQINQANQLQFEDEKSRGLLGLQQAMRREEIALGQADKRTEQITRASEREQDRGVRVRERVQATEDERSLIELKAKLDKQNIRFRARLTQEFSDKIKDKEGVGRGIVAANIALSGIDPNTGQPIPEFSTMSEIVATRIEAEGPQKAEKIVDEMLADFTREEIDPSVLGEEERQMVINHWLKNMASVVNSLNKRGAPEDFQADRKALSRSERRNFFEKGLRRVIGGSTPDDSIPAQNPQQGGSFLDSILSGTPIPEQRLIDAGAVKNPDGTFTLPDGRIVGGSLLGSLVR